VDGDGIAKFALWLAKHRPVEKTGRFLVTGTDSALQRTLTTRRDLPDSVTNWCVAYLLNPAKIDSTGLMQVRVKKGQLLVNARGISENWETYQTNRKPPPPGRISRALKSLCHEDKIQLKDNAGGRPRYHVFRTDLLIYWGETIGYCTKEQIEEALSTDTEDRNI
jgi:hypothetical protein